MFSMPLRTLSIAEKAAFQAGFRDMLRPVPGVIAWGLVTGIAMVKAGLGVLPSVVISLTAYAGSAQLATLPLVITGAAWWVILLAAIVVNLRFTVYSTTLGQLFAGERPWQRVLLGYFNGDITFLRLLAYLTQKPSPPQTRAFFLGGACCNWLGWQLGSLIGIFAAARIPREWGFEIAGILVLVAVVAPALRGRAALAGATVAALVAVAARGLPLQLGVLAGLLAGSVTSLLLTPRAATVGTDDAIP